MSDKKTQKKFKISIIMAVYMVEDYIREAIDSIIAQKMNFEKNIQLILVDDGSPDSSGAVCDEYAAKYPENIFVVHKENGGVSSARNAGLELVRGELVNFTDPDDFLTPDTCSLVYDFYKENKDSVDVIGIPLHFFDGETGGHVQNYKFAGGSRVVDLEEEWSFIQLSVCASFTTASCIKGLRFDDKLKYGEDAHFLLRALDKKRALGLVYGPKYMYRKRQGGSSAIQSATSRKIWYTSTLENFHESIIGYYTERYGSVPKFVQYALMYDLQWRIKMQNLPEGVLTKEEGEEYSEKLDGLFRYIDDDVIQSQRNLHKTYKFMVLLKKHGSYTAVKTDDDLLLTFGDTVGTRLSEAFCRLEALELKDGMCHIECALVTYDAWKDVTLQVLANDRCYSCIPKEKVPRFFSLGKPGAHAQYFDVTFPLEPENNISFQVSHGDTQLPILTFDISNFIPVNNRKYKHAFAYEQGYKINILKDSIVIKAVNQKKVPSLERKFLWELWRRNRLGERKAVIARILRHRFLKKKTRPLWLISDRAALAGDNGEALFRYLIENHPEIDARFVINKDCSDYQRLSQIGPVVARDSFENKLLHICCDYIISSHAETDIFNPFIGYTEPYRDIISRVKFVFLQHGVIHTDLSTWLDRYAKNIYGFITSAHNEAKSISEYGYHYPQDRIWLTGLPRHDRLYHAEEKIITVMPTWRKYLMGAISSKEKTWAVSDTFLESDYLKYYSSLLNDKRLLDAAKKHGYTIAFFPHPNIQAYMEYFPKNDDVLFWSPNTEYRDILAKSNIIVSDYSSVVFDFAYLRKPIVYTQFDYELFFSGAHTLERGYFSYEDDGFGEVEYSLDDTVDRLIEYMENGCELKEKYRQRINSFFAFNDQNCCQRVYEEIINRENK